MSTELIINASLPEIRIALLGNGEIQELLVERSSEKGIVGNIYKGRVTRVLPGMQAAFVDIGLEKAAFLYVDDVFVRAELWGEGEEEPAQEPETDLPNEGVEEAGGSDPSVLMGPDEGESDKPPGTVVQGEGGEGANRNPRRGRRGGRGGSPSRRGPIDRSPRRRDRRIPPKLARPHRTEVSIQDLLKEGQEVMVQVAKAPIATKGARLTCHISLPGRHLVCMPTIDHVGVSRKIEREDERRKLREQVEACRPKGIGFIVRTATGRGQSDKRIEQDIDYLTNLWTEIRDKGSTLTAPSLVYEDLNAVLRSIRDWVSEDIDKVIVDSRYHYNELLQFISHFMPSLKQKIELYHGDIPIFDAYNISPELSRALERKVWLKSGGYIVIDQTEALVAIDVNTGRFVGKKNLEDTIFRTNLEAVQEISYQLRLRNCGGIIILDLIDMENDENRQRVYRALEEALQKDRARPTILKISELGLVEMTRKRTRDTMTRILSEPCSHCEGKGFTKTKKTVAYEVLREIERVGIDRDTTGFLVQAHSEVIDVLAIDERETLDQLERRYRKEIYLQAVHDFHPEQFVVSSDKTLKKKTPEPKVQQSMPQKPIVPKPTEKAPTDQEPEEELPTEQEPTEVQAAPTRTQKFPEDINEEDRLAFLRAQAAQDAALAQGITPKTQRPTPRPGGRPMAGGGWRNRNNPRMRGRNGGGGGGRYGRMDPRRPQGFGNGGGRPPGYSAPVAESAAPKKETTSEVTPVVAAPPTSTEQGEN